MASIGDKIKEALTGHSHKDTSEVHTPDVNAPGAYPADDKTVIESHTNLTKRGHEHRDNEIGARHTQGRHDPEVDAKEATSQAGNYPYWGDLPQDGKEGHSHHQPGATAVGGTHGAQSHSLQKESGVAAGALATGAGAAGAASRGSRASEYEPRPLGTQTTTSTTQNLTDRTRDSGLTSSSQAPGATQSTKDSHRGELAAATGAGAAGIAGATYLGTRHRDDERGDNATSGSATEPTQAGTGSVGTGYASQTTSSTAKPQEYTGTASHDSPSTTTPGFNNSHRKEEGALAAGAGAAGLGGAGYLAHKRAEEHSRAEEPSTTLHGSQQRGTTSGLPSSQPQSTTSGGIHNTVIGAGSGEDTHSRSHKPAFDSSQLSSSNTASVVGAQRGTVDPREQQTISSVLGSAPHSGNDREKQGLAAAAGVGAGAGAVAAEEKHRHHEHRHHDDKTKDHQGHSLFGSSHKHDDKTPHDRHAQPAQTAPASQQPSAQLAAQQAWTNQNQGSTATHQTPEYNEGEDRLRSNTGHQHTAALGTAAGAGLAGAGATAAYYGQGREHDQNPRSAESQKIADRALGSDGAAHAPTAGQGQGGSVTSGLSSSAGAGAAGLSGNVGQNPSKVLHKCHQCGADNDISDYFKKDAGSRIGS